MEGNNAVEPDDDAATVLHTFAPDESEFELDLETETFALAPAVTAPAVAPAPTPAAAKQRDRDREPDQDWQLQGARLNTRHLRESPRYLYIHPIPSPGAFWNLHFGKEALPPSHFHVMNYKQMTISLSHKNPLWCLGEREFGGGAEAIESFFASAKYRCQPSVDADGFVHASHVCNASKPLDYKNCALLGVFLHAVSSTNTECPLGVSVGHVATRVPDKDETLGDWCVSTKELKRPTMYSFGNEKRDGARPPVVLRYHDVVGVPDFGTEFSAGAGVAGAAAETEKSRMQTAFGGRWIAAQTAENTMESYTTTILPTRIGAPIDFHPPRRMTNMDFSAASEVAALNPDLTTMSVENEFMAAWDDQLRGIGFAAAAPATAAGKPVVETYDEHSFAVCDPSELFRANVRPQGKDVANRYGAKLKKEFSIFAKSLDELCDLNAKFVDFLRYTPAGRAMQETINKHRAQFMATPKWLDAEKTVRNLTEDELTVVTSLRFTIAADSKIIGTIRQQDLFDVEDSTDKRVTYSTMFRAVSNFKETSGASRRALETRDMSRIAIHAQPTSRLCATSPWTCVLQVAFLYMPRETNGPDPQTQPPRSGVTTHRPLSTGSITPAQFARFVTL